MYLTEASHLTLRAWVRGHDPEKKYLLRTVGMVFPGDTLSNDSVARKWRMKALNRIEVTKCITTNYDSQHSSVQRSSLVSSCSLFPVFFQSFQAGKKSYYSSLRLSVPKFSLNFRLPG